MNERSGVVGRYKITPLRKRLLIKPIKSSETTKSGIVLAGEKKSDRAEVIAIGEEVKGELKLGDIVLFQSYGGREVELEDERYLFVEEDEILAKEI